MSSRNWYLEGLRESGELQRVALRPLPFRVGRRFDSDLRLESQHGSQNHAEFFYRDGRLWLRDLGSTNGTAVNGQRIHREEAIQNGDMVHFADQEFRVRAEVAHQNNPLQTQVFSQTQRRRLESLVRKPLAFREMLERDRLHTDFQPLVRFSDGQTFGYEVLGRGDLDDSRTSPADLFFIAEKLHEEIPLSVAFRSKGLEFGHDLPGDPMLFVNTHPAELEDTGALLKSLEDLRGAYPQSRIALEIHEATIADIAALKTLRQGLESLEIRLAFDDFGTGQARLLELIEVQPHYLKFDAVLIENIHLAVGRRQEMLANLVRLVLGMEICPVAECIERKEEADVCAELGFELAQGYYFGRPAPAKHFR